MLMFTQLTRRIVRHSLSHGCVLLVMTSALSAPSFASAPPTTPPDWPRAGGFGPSGHSFGSPGSGTNIIDTLVGDTSGRDWTDKDLASIIEIGAQISPRWGKALQERFDSDPQEMKRSLRGGGRRLAAMLVLREKAPAVFEAKIAELRAAAESQRLMDTLLQARARNASPEEVDALDAALLAAARVEVDLSLKTRAEELRALEDALTRFKDELAADAAHREELSAALVERLHSAPRGPKRPLQ
ncbi:MAG: hypothetical protein EXS10_00420 [Phycisphaerales bacterium]|nr:hypothetical protein [Phycisphaerales bacterium]